VTRRRCDIVDAGSPGVYHCISRCVRREFLLDDPGRRAWIVERLQFLTEWMAIDVISFAVMQNHIHLLLAIRPDVVELWSDREVAERRLALMQDRRQRRRAGIDPEAPPTAEEIIRLLSSAGSLARARGDLCNLGLFHRLLKEPCAKMWNREDGVTGHFWEGRFKSPRVLDLEGLVHVATYIELNQVHACAASTVDDSVWTSASLQWRRMVGAVRAVAQANEDMVTPELIASRVIAEEWRPAIPCRLRIGTREADATRPAARECPMDSAQSWAGSALGAVGTRVKLAIHLENLNLAGQCARPDKHGRIASGSASPTETAILVARRHDPCDCEARPCDNRSNESPLRCFVAACVDAIAAAGVVFSCSVGTSGRAPRPASVAVSRGSCYGGAEAVAREARRRGLSRLWVGLRASDQDLDAA